MELLKLAAFILVGYFVLRFLWNAAKGMIKLILIIVVIAVGVYLYDKELVYNVFGKENTEAVVDKTTELVDKSTEVIKEKADSLKKDVTN